MHARPPFRLGRAHPLGVRGQTQMVGRGFTSAWPRESTVEPGCPWTRIQWVCNGCPVGGAATRQQESHPREASPLSGRVACWGWGAGRSAGCRGYPLGFLSIRSRASPIRRGSVSGVAPVPGAPPPARQGDTVLDRQVQSSDGLVRPRGEEKQRQESLPVEHTPRAGVPGN